MDLTFAYHRRSAVRREATGLSIALAPNLRRDRVAFNGALKQPLKFREAISALHDVVISDLRYRPKDKTAYEAYKAAELQREQVIRQQAVEAKKAATQPQLGMPPTLEADYGAMRGKYWRARQQYSNYLLKHDQELWRLMMPCDPVITVAPDCLFFECFSADESSYGCLTVDRDAFTGEQDTALGTTNVDYSWALYEHFQKLRSYRETRFEVDPAGFDVKTEETADHREEKIDLPNSWLRGFMQLQSAMSFPTRKVSISREGLYNVLAFLRRRKAARSPRAVRFEMEPGKPVAIVLEPWEKRIVLHTTPSEVERPQTIRVWGRDRLRVLARLLPLAEQIEVHLLGTGLPSFWTIRMGGMRMILGLSGWTTNDWTAGSALSQIAPPVEIDEATLRSVAGAFTQSPALGFDEICRAASQPAPIVAAGLNRLALLGQVIHDFPAGVYRWRQVMPQLLSQEQLGREDIETEKGRELLKHGRVKVERDETTASGLRVLAAVIKSPSYSDRKVELALDADGRILRGKCLCSHHFKNGLRKGPCRHLQVLRNHLLASEQRSDQTLDRWFSSLWSQPA